MIQSRPSTDAYRSGWDRTFKKPKPRVFRNVRTVRDSAINLALKKLQMQHPHANDWNRDWPSEVSRDPR